MLPPCVLPTSILGDYGAAVGVGPLAELWILIRAVVLPSYLPSQLVAWHPCIFDRKWIYTCVSQRNNHSKRLLVSFAFSRGGEASWECGKVGYQWMYACRLLSYNDCIREPKITGIELQGMRLDCLLDVIGKEMVNVSLGGVSECDRNDIPLALRLKQETCDDLIHVMRAFLAHCFIKSFLQA